MNAKAELNPGGMNHSMDSLVKCDRLQQLYRQSFPGLFVSVIIAALLARILWEQEKSSIPLIWFGAVLFSGFVRLLLFLVYLKVKPRVESMLAWERPYFYTLMLASTVWGVGALYLVDASSAHGQTMVMYFLMGMAGGALSVYSAHRAFAMTAILVVLGPYTIWLVVQNEPIKLMMAVASLVYIFSANRATRISESALHSSLLLGRQLSLTKATAEQEARTDALTGLMNRRAFEEGASRLFDQSDRNRRPACLIILDLDHFKRVNDSYGHAAGDQALRHAADIVRQSVRGADLCARLGGEEFAVLLPNTVLDSGLEVAEKIRQRIEEQPVVSSNGTFKLSASLGVAEGIQSLEEVIKRADEAMYSAKRGGRNQVAH